MNPPKKTAAIEYNLLSDKMKGKLPAFFKEDFQKWSNDQMDDEMEKFFNFTKKSMDDAKAPLVAAFTKFMASRPAPAAGFLDLRFEHDEDGVPRVYFWAVPANFKDTDTYPPGEEVHLGETHPLLGWAHSLAGMMERLSSGGRLGKDLQAEAREMNYDWAMKRLLKTAWDEAGGATWGAPMFLRHSFSNQWVDTVDSTKIYWLNDVKEIAKELKGENGKPERVKIAAVVAKKVLPAKKAAPAKKKATPTKKVKSAAKAKNSKNAKPTKAAKPAKKAAKKK